MERRSSSQDCVATGNQGASYSRQARPLGLPLNPLGLLLDSRVVDMPMASNPNFVLLSSLKPLFFNGLKNALCFSDNAGA